MMIPKPLTLSAALELWKFRTSLPTGPRCRPLRKTPVIIAGPDDETFCVVDLQFAEANEFAPLRINELIAA